MAVNLSPIWGAGAQLLDNSGNVLSGGKIYTYAAGTTTQVATYTSNSGITANSNPIVLNSAGRVPYEIWLTDGQNYKFVLKDSNDVLIGTWDNLSGINSNFVAYTNQQEIQTATAGQTVFNLTTMQYLPGTGNLSVFVDGVNQYGPGAQYAFEETDQTTVTFASGLHVGASVKFTSTQIQNAGVADASQISYTFPATGAFTTNVEERLSRFVLLEDFIDPAELDQTQAFIRAAEYLLSQTNPGGTIQVTSNVTVQAGEINFWDILVAEQGLTPPYNYLPNGELVRGTQINLQGQGTDQSTIRVTGSGSAFTWGYFTDISNQRAMSGVVNGIAFEGPGDVGSTSQVIIAGVQGFSTTTSATAGTTNTDTICLDFQTISPNTSVENCRFRYFQNAVYNRYGFGLVLDGTQIQYCNIGVHIGDGCTTWEVRSGCEIEVCGVGIYSQYSNKGSVGAAVIEANVAGCDILAAGTRFLNLNGTWFEGSLQNVVLRGDLYAPSLPNAEHSYNDLIGLNIDDKGGVRNLIVTNCNMNLLGESYSVNSGEQFSNVVYNNCWVDGGPFDISSISVDGIATFDDIHVIGPTENGTITDYVSRDPLYKRSVTSVAANTAQNTITMTVPNIATTTRLVIEATKVDPAGTYRTQTMRYVGVIVRAVNGATNYYPSSTESIVTTYASTGSNNPVTVTVPTFAITGANTVTQTLTIKFATGTPVSDTSNTFWDATAYPDVDGIVFA